MEWTADVSNGDWIREGLDAPWRGTIHDVVPRGFPAYARVFHPATRERPVDGVWPAEDDRRGWQAFMAVPHEIDVEPVTWAETAEAFETRMHPLAQWNRLVRSDSPYSGGTPRDGAGHRYTDPPRGQLDAASWAVLAGVLARHTTTPDDGGVAVWEGWGGLVGGMGYGASRMLFEAGADIQHAEFLAHAARDMFNDVFKKPTWQTGILSDEISRGARLELPGRPYVLFRGGVAELTEDGWPARMPWADHELLAHGLPSNPESPGIVWPADRAWIVVSEVDFDSTIVGCDQALLGELLRTPGLEVQVLPADADLSWDADDLNRP
ncbi:hypothetical protein [Microbacterium candidum]|uniref:Uncharacterized protein n=1 Tax=Microbacterium candidum TaxID=3041922 RepID=A0ABT7MU70_9MICO|nr:hypothetical protein [Microbacterium sp. ASV49]MDL9977992.1 hypothetical protein [Microbacterium sp. ASV49]